MKHLFGWLIVACLLAACGNPDSGPPLGDFPAIEKTTTDTPFTLVAPSSRSPAPFTFTSSNAAVATIDGATVTIHGAGTSTITAAQGSVGSFGPTSKSTTLTVTGDACPAGQVLRNGTCQPANCISPATLQGSQCVAPQSSGTTVTQPGLIWNGVTATDTAANASAFCTGSIINSVAAWRQPTQAELSALFASGSMNGKNWALGDTWSSDPGATPGTHVVVNLQTGATATRDDTAMANVSCVHQP